MSFRGAARVVIRAGLLTGLCVLTAVGAFTAPAHAAVPGPTVVSPTDHQALDYGGDIAVRVNPVDGASGYLYGFFQNDVMVWENYANERHLSGTDYTIAASTPAHAAIKPGALQIWVRAWLNGAWTDATILNVTLGGGGGEILGLASCGNNTAPTRVRIQAETGEGVDAAFTSRSQDRTAVHYSARMSTIQGGINDTGTTVTISVSCDGVLAGGTQVSLGPSSDHTWTENLYHCAAGKCD